MAVNPDSHTRKRKRVTNQWGLDPFPWYEQMLHEEPVHYNEEEQGWDIFRYQDIKEILLSPALYSSERVKDPEDLVSRDAPRHQELRALMVEAFTSCLPSPTRIREIATELLASGTSGHLDMIGDIAIPLPIRVIAEMLGVPMADLPMMTSWSKTFVSAEGKQAEVSLAKYFMNLIAQKRMSPGNDITSAMLQAEIQGKLTMRELVTNCVLLFVAGNETTTNLIGNAMHCFEEHPGVLQQLQEDPTLIPGALEEVLRFRSPVQRTPRVARTDVIIADHQIKAGQYLYLWLGAANRDPEQFPNPNGFDIKRSPSHHLAFGHGVHFCMGAALARLEAKVALECLLERFCEIERDQATPLQPADTFFGLGLKEYHVTVKPRN